MSEERIPKNFIRAFLKARGWKELNTVYCGCTKEFVETDHPIQWLWDHVKQGHRPGFDACLCWDRQIGDGTYFDLYYRWYDCHWDGECFVLTIEEEDYEPEVHWSQRGKG